MNKKFYIKKNLIGFIVGAFIISISSVLAITYFPSSSTIYDNSDSGMTSTNVQDAINELYEICSAKSAGEQIIENAGLEKDQYEDRYFFKGKNVNNYITFNNETWRIVSVEADNTIKIMREASIGNRAWDEGGGTNGSNNWARPADLNTYLNGDYLKGTLNQTAQKQIVSKNWSVGAISYAESSMSKQIQDENSRKWNGKVALVTVSEYIRSNSNQASCGTFDLNEDNFMSCQNTTWMFNYTYWWTSTRITGNTSGVFYVISPGSVGYTYANIAYITVRPSVYLSSDIKITGGDGSQNNPYQISL